MSVGWYLSGFLFQILDSLFPSLLFCISVQIDFFFLYRFIPWYSFHQFSECTAWKSSAFFTLFRSVFPKIFWTSLFESGEQRQMSASFLRPGSLRISSMFAIADVVWKKISSEIRTWCRHVLSSTSSYREKLDSGCRRYLHHCWSSWSLISYFSERNVCCFSSPIPPIESVFWLHHIPPPPFSRRLELEFRQGAFCLFRKENTFFSIFLWQTFLLSLYFDDLEWLSCSWFLFWI